MPKGGRKRAAAAGGGAARKKGAPAARSSAHLLVHTPSAADCGGAPPIEPEEPPSMLGALVWPLSKEGFLADAFRQRAVATVAPPGSAALGPRTAAAAAALCGLDLEAMLSETASERLFVWMRSEAKADERVASFEVDEPRAAMICHDAGGSLYFRSPEAMVNPWVGRLSAELGLNFGAVYSQPAAGPGALPQKGEIEVFATRAGHTTDWHTDFMENFTLQLKGRKRWRIAQSGLEAPIRGYTPHYKSVDNLAQQLKVHRMQQPSFPAPVPWDASASGDDGTDVVELGPGDFLYHPAGIWHRVECTEDSLSMNISLLGLSWADHIADAARHAMWRHAPMRAPVVVRPSTYGKARADAEQRLAAARRQLDGLRGEDIMPPCLLLPRYEGEWIVGMHGDGRRLSPQSSDAERDAGSSAEEEAEEAAEAEEAEEEESFLARGEDAADVVSVVATGSSWLRINPLAVLLRVGEEEEARGAGAEAGAGAGADAAAGAEAGASKRAAGDEDEEEDEDEDEDAEEDAEDEEELGGLLYVCHVMFGNEELGSTVETHIRYDPAQHHPTTHPAGTLSVSQQHRTPTERRPVRVCVCVCTQSR